MNLLSIFCQTMLDLYSSLLGEDVRVKFSLRAEGQVLIPILGLLSSSVPKHR